MLRKYAHSNLGEIDLDAILRKRALVLGGAKRSSSTAITQTLPPRLFLDWSDSSQHRTTSRGVGASYRKLVAQMRQTTVPSSPLVESVLETDFTYPRDKVVNIRKGLKLRKRG